MSIYRCLNKKIIPVPGTALVRLNQKHMASVKTLLVPVGTNF